jgi:hypothetical protein
LLPHITEQQADRQGLKTSEMKQRYLRYVYVVEGNIEGTEKRGRRRKQLWITITKIEDTGT